VASGFPDIEAWVPHSDAESRWRTLLLVQFFSNGVPLALAMAALFGVLGRPWLALICVLSAASLGLSLAVLRWSGSLRLAAHLSLGLCLALFLIAAGIEQPLDGAGLCFLGLVPYVALLLLTRREALGWAALAATAAIGLVVGRQLGLIGALMPSSVEGSLVRALGLGAIFLIFGWRFDVERRLAQQEAERVNRARSAFLANMSHEIRTPMNGVLGMLEVMLLQGPLNAEQREQLDLAHRSGESLVGLINDLLDMSKIEAGKLEVVNGPFAVSGLMNDLHHLFEPVAQQKRLKFRFEVPRHLPPWLRGDALRLRQVLSNLINNALKFTEAGEVELSVGWAGPPGRLRFAVSDTGIGISAEALPRLMVPFAQADASTTRRYGGTGLGLALSRELVALMGGTLTVASEVGQGSLFSFDLDLPAADAPPVAVALSPPRGTPAALAVRLPVLVVDDNVINLRVACSLVQRAGFTTRTATNGREALEALQHERFALVLMDCHMPVMDGYETTERIRAMPGDLAHTPIVALTASAMPEDLELCRKAGMDECLCKPIKFEVLRSVLQHFEAPGAVEAAGLLPVVDGRAHHQEVVAGRPDEGDPRRGTGR
jgi:signal transduction histidine kinase/CheY-like chemotaxis protein